MAVKTKPKPTRKPTASKPTRKPTASKRTRKPTERQLLKLILAQAEAVIALPDDINSEFIARRALLAEHVVRLREYLA